MGREKKKTYFLWLRYRSQCPVNRKEVISFMVRNTARDSKFNKVYLILLNQERRDGNEGKSYY